MRKITILAITVPIVFGIGIALFFLNSYDLMPTKENDFGIDARVVYEPNTAVMCPTSPCDTSGYALKVSSKTNAFLMGYNICNGIFCVKQGGGSLFLSSENDPREQEVFIFGNVPWKVGDIVNIRVKVTGAVVADGKYFPNPHKTIFIDLGESKVIRG